MKIGSKTSRKGLPTHISIIGSGVCRDIFSLSKNAEGYRANENEYVVDRFVPDINPLSAIGDPVEPNIAERMLEESANSTASDFDKHNFKLDILKTWRSFLEEVKSDWLIVDLSTVRLEMLRWKNTYVTYESVTNMVKGQIALDENSALCKLKEKRRFGVWDIDDAMLKIVYRHFFDELLKLYSQERIIIVDLKHAYTYIDEQDEVVSFPNDVKSQQYRQDDHEIDFAYQCAKFMMPRAYYIDALPTMVGNAKLVREKGERYYVDDVYLYYFRCIDLITHCTSRKKIKELMMEIQLMCMQGVFNHYSKTVKLCVQNQKNMLLEIQGVIPGTYRKNGLTLTVTSDYRFHLKGTATQDTALYLCSAHKNPCGGWQLVKKEFTSGTYLFTTRIESDENRMFVQLIFVNEKDEQKWITGNVSTTFQLDKPYQGLISRIIVKRGVAMNCRGTIILEKLD